MALGSSGITRTLPSLIGVIHLPPLPGSPLAPARAIDEAVAAAARDAQALGEAGFGGIIIENFGDKPFFPGPVPPITVAAMTACAMAARAAAPGVALGINVLRNDASAALGIAVAAGASFIRVNIHASARITDQGIVQGKAHKTLRERAALGARHIALLCDVDVKHAAAIAPRALSDEAEELAERALADALLVTGRATGAAADPHAVSTVASATGRPVYVASGATADNIGSFSSAYGFIVGTALRATRRAGDPVDFALAKAFVDAAAAARARA